MFARKEQMVKDNSCICTKCNNVSGTSGVDVSTITIKYQLLRSAIQKYVIDNHLNLDGTELKSLLDQI
jgi:hypothetical protein